MTDFTEPLDPDIPADSELVSTGDDSIRQFKRAIIERLDSFFKDLGVTPLEPRAESVPGAAIKPGSLGADQLDPALNFKSILLRTISVSATLTFPHGTYVHDYSIADAEVGDIVVVLNPGSAATFVFKHAWVPADGTVTVTLGNDSDSTGLTFADESMVLVIIKPGKPGSLHGELLKTIPYTDFRVSDPAMVVAISLAEIATTAVGAYTLFGSIGLAPGSKISGASIRIRSDDTATIGVDLHKTDIGGVSTVLSHMDAAVGGGLQTLFDTFDYTVVDGDEFTFQVTIDTTGDGAPGGAAILWAKLTLA